MLGFLALAFTHGAVKAAAHGRKRAGDGHLFTELPAFGLGELTEELEFRVALERGLGRKVLKLSPTAARLGQAALFGLAHPGLEVDAAAGALLYSFAYDAGVKRAEEKAKSAPPTTPTTSPHLSGIITSTLAHLAHNVGVWFGST